MAKRFEGALGEVLVEMADTVHHWGRLKEKTQEEIIKSLKPRLKENIESAKKYMPKQMRSCNEEEIIKDLLSHEIWKISRSREASGDKNLGKLHDCIYRRPNLKKFYQELNKTKGKFPILKALAKEQEEYN